MKVLNYGWTKSRIRQFILVKSRDVNMQVWKIQNYLHDIIVREKTNQCSSQKFGNFS